VSSKPAPAVPNSLPIADALQRCAPLAALRERLRDSNARFDAIRAVVPAAMLVHLKPGPVDESGWTLLAANPAVAAKTRQLAPRLQQSLQDQGWQVSALRIKVQSS
jgi:hypothetical protein